MTYVCHECGHLSSLHGLAGCGFRSSASGPRGVPCECKDLCVEVTPCEMEVWRGIAVGKSPKELAGAVATKTIECHASNLYHKLGVHSRVQLTALALHLGVIQLRDIPTPNVTLALVPHGVAKG